MKNDVAVEALDYLVEQLSPYITGLDSEEIGEIYMKAVKKLG